MTEFFRLMGESREFQALAAAAGFLLLVVAYQAVALAGLRRQWSRVLREARGESLEAMLERHLESHKAHGAKLERAEERLKTLEGKMRTAIRYVGLVRYDAFGEVGGQQSFSLALYDEEGRGAVVTSQVGREACRVYGKELDRGKADRPLAAEEAQAIEAAVDGPARARIML
jgi:hypothetical protein